MSTSLSVFQTWLYLDLWRWWWVPPIPPRNQELCWWGDAAVGSLGLCVWKDRTLRCLQCHAGERCAVRKGARIGKLCDCPRGTTCNSFLLKCLWGFRPPPWILPAPASPERTTPSSLEFGFSNKVCVSLWGLKRLSSCCSQIKEYIRCYCVKDNALYGVGTCVHVQSFLIHLTNSYPSLCKEGELCFENCIFVCGVAGWTLDLVTLGGWQHNLEDNPKWHKLQHVQTIHNKVFLRIAFTASLFLCRKQCQEEWWN